MTITSHFHSTRTQRAIHVLHSYAAHPFVVPLQVDLTNMCRAALGLWWGKRGSKARGTTTPA